MDAGNQGWGPGASSKADSPPEQLAGKSFHRRREGLQAQPALTGILELVIGGRTSTIWLFSLQLVCSSSSPFFEASSRNCGSLCHGWASSEQFWITDPSASDQNPPAGAGDARDVGSIPGSGRRAQQPTPVLLPGEFHRQRSLAGYR